MKKTIISILAFSMVLGMNAAHAEDADAKLQQLQQALAQNPNDTKLLTDTGIALSKAGKYDQAESLFIRSLTITEKKLNKNNPNPLLIMLYNLGFFYKNQAKYSQAESYYIRSVEIMEKKLGKDHPDVAMFLNNLAVLYDEEGKYEQAEPLHLRSLAIAEKALGKDHPDVASVLNNLAAVYQNQGRYTEAERLYSRSLTIDNSVITLSNLASLYAKQSKYNQAELLNQRSLAIREKVLGKEHVDVAISLDHLAQNYQSQGTLDKAEPLYLHSLAIREKNLGKDHIDVALSLNHLAKLYKTQNKYEQAEPLYLRSLAIFEKAIGQDHSNVASSLEDLALLYITQDDYNKAEPLYQRSLRIMNQSLKRWLWGAGEKTRQSYLQKEEDTRNLYLSFYSLANTPDEAFYFSLSRKGLLLRISSEISALAKQSSNPAIQKQTQEFNTLKSQLASLAFSGKAEDKAKIKALEEQGNTLEMQLSQKVASFKRGKTEVTPQDVLEKLEPEQSVIDFLVYKERDLKTNQNKTEQVIALIADKENSIKLIKLGELAPINNAITRYRQSIKPRNRKPDESAKDYAEYQAIRAESLTYASQDLYKLVWQPLSSHLATKTEIYLIPDGALHLFPFKALQDEKGHYLAEKQQITLLSSARDIVLPPLEGKANDSVIFAAPTFGNKGDKTNITITRSVVTNRGDIQFAPLEGAAAEGKALNTLIKTKQPAQLFQDKQATETAVAAIKAPRFLHFATHGFFLENLPQPSADKKRSLGLMQESNANNFQLTENPLTRSGLALTGANLGIIGKKQADGTDGILTALEVLALNLEGTDLVTLSACETGVGDIQVGEGVYSLNRAFQEAGAKSVLSTLWSVADEQTKLFMQEFYTLVLNGDTPQQALQKTQLKFINDKNLKDPFFWAAFTVVGI